MVYKIELPSSPLLLITARYHCTNTPLGFVSLHHFPFPVLSKHTQKAQEILSLLSLTPASCSNCITRLVAWERGTQCHFDSRFVDGCDGEDHHLFQCPYRYEENY